MHEFRPRCASHRDSPFSIQDEMSFDCLSRRDPPFYTQDKMSFDAKDASSKWPIAKPSINQAHDPKVKNPIPPMMAESSPFPFVSILPVDEGGFSPSQRPAADIITQFMKDHPDQLIPSNLITEPLIEIQGRDGWCLIGGCRITRRKQRLDPANDRMGPWMRRDHLLYHVREKHFHSKPFECGHWCAFNLTH